METTTKLEGQSGRPSRRRVMQSAAGFGVFAGVGATGLTTLAGCGTGEGPKSGKGAGRPGKAGETLFFAGLQWGTPTHFNPLGAPSPGWPCGYNSQQYIYETLVRYNLLSGELEPGLATGLEERDENTFVLKMQPDAKFHDGKPVTADDAVYTLMLGKQFPEIQYGADMQYIDSVTKEGDSVVVKLSTKKRNPRMVKRLIAETFVLPKHVWEPEIAKAKSPLEVKNLEPVGSGPYQLDNYNAQQVGLKRYDKYWGTKLQGGKIPKVKYLVHQIFKDNTGGNLGLEQGSVDISQQFAPKIWLMWEQKKQPVATWYKKQPYHIPGGIPQLMINTTKKGLNNPKVRRAIAFALDYKRIADIAMSRYSVPAKSSLIVPTGPEEKFFDQALVDKYGWKYDPKETERILEGEGAKKGKDGVWVLKDGTRLGPWTLQTPSGWGEWQDTLEIVAENLKAVGIDASTKFPQAPAVTTNIQNGNFDMGMWNVASTGPATPWQRFRDILEIRDVPKVGKQTFWNFGRFEHPDVPALLDKAAAATDDDEAKPHLLALDKIYMDHAPTIPLQYRPVFYYEFNTKNWKGFPTSDNDFAPPQFNGAGVNWIFKLERA